MEVGLSEATKIISISELSAPRYLLCPNSKREFQIFDGITIGRQHGDIIFSDDRSVSSKHFSIAINGGACVLEDLNSSNGVFINGKRVEHKAKLNFGDKIKFGNQELLYSDKLFDEVVLIVRPKFKAAFKESVKNFYKIQHWDWSTGILAFVLSIFGFFVYLIDFGVWNKKDLLFSHLELSFFFSVDLVVFPLMILCLHQTLIHYFRMKSSFAFVFMKFFLFFSYIPFYLLFNLTINSVTS